MDIAFLGFGLIAGSVARALRESATPAGRITAWSPTGAGAQQALAEGIVDDVAADVAAAVEGAGLVILAAPPTAVLDLLADVAALPAGGLAPSAVVTDVASTKGRIVARADALGLAFVGGHPMAGLESSGYGASRADLFRERPWVVVPPGRAGGEAADPAREARVAVVEELARQVGARPVRMDAAAHDAAVASISHLPLVLAAALVEAVAGGVEGAPPDWPSARALAASGWRDMTRLARGDVAMGVGIAATNADAIADRLRAVRTALDAWLAELERDGGPDTDRLAARFQAARDALEREAP